MNQATGYPVLALEPAGPTLENFLLADPHWSNPPETSAELVEATHNRLGIVLPPLLRTIYLKQNGGYSHFLYAAASPGSSLSPLDDDAFFKTWHSALPGEELLPLGMLETMGMLEDSMDRDPDFSWRVHLPDADRLVCLSRKAFDIYLCLDYGNGNEAPGLVLFDDGCWSPGEAQPFVAKWSDFNTFFAGLRRHTVTEVDGIFYRGLQPVEPENQSR